MPIQKENDFVEELSMWLKSTGINPDRDPKRV